MKVYKYTPLDGAQDEIRLMRLLPGAFSDDIKIEIFHSSLRQIENDHEIGAHEKQSMGRRAWDKITNSPKRKDAENGLSYEALSYVWGSEEDPSFAYIRGRKRLVSSSLTITRNLDEAMRHLRKADASRILWIDAVCINQEDLVERGFQVSKMGDIFRHATQVAVWLGPEADRSDVAVDLVYSIAADLIVPDDRGDRDDSYIAIPGSNAAKLLTHPDDFESGIEALRKLCRRQWFKRLWIYQEYHLSRAAIGIVGRRTLDIRILFKVLAFLHNSPTGNYRTTGPISHVQNLLKPIRGDQIPTRITYALKDSRCSDDRDRVFAILGLLGSRYRAAIVPDYSKSVQEVNKAYFLALLNNVSTMELWGSGEENESTSPSWIPSLTNKLSRFSTEYRASGNSCHGISYRSTDESLRTGAKSVGVISKIWFILPRALGIRKSLKLIRAHGQPPTADSNYVLGGSWLDTYVGALAGGRYREVRNFPWIPSLAELRDLVQSKDFPEEKLGTAQGSSAFRNSKSRALFSTAEGLMGICHISGKVGDRVYIVPGIDTAVLLSCVEGKPNHYRLKGECYAHGLMNSEALLGQLYAVAPQGEWHYQFQYVQGHRRVVFTNGAMKTQNDPRLGPMPEGWKNVYLCKSDGCDYDTEQGQDGKLRLLRFKQIQTGKDARYDPRMTVAALRARGVVLEDIVIV